MPPILLDPTPLKYLFLVYDSFRCRTDRDDRGGAHQHFGLIFSVAINHSRSDHSLTASTLTSAHLSCFHSRGTAQNAFLIASNGIHSGIPAPPPRKVVRGVRIMVSCRNARFSNEPMLPHPVVRSPARPHVFFYGWCLFCFCCGCFIDCMVSLNATPSLFWPVVGNTGRSIF